MDIQQLESFMQIAHHRGFNRASAHLNIAQSALSRQIKLLENELGVELFVRNARGVHLTPAGDLLLSRATAILRQVRQTREELMVQSEMPRGEVCIGLPPSLEEVVGVPLLTRFLESYPEVQLTSRTGVSIELREWVLSGEVDLAIYGILQPETILEAQPFFRDRVVVAGPPDWDWGEADELSIRDIVDLPLILTPRPNSLRLLVDHAADRAQIKMNVTMQLQSIPLTLAMLHRGHGFSVVPSTIAHQPIAMGMISARPLRYLSYNWIIAHSRERPLSIASMRLIDMVHEIGMGEPIATSKLDLP